MRINNNSSSREDIMDSNPTPIIPPSADTTAFWARFTEALATPLTLHIGRREDRRELRDLSLGELRGVAALLRCPSERVTFEVDRDSDRGPRHSALYRVLINGRKRHHVASGLLFKVRPRLSRDHKADLQRIRRAVLMFSIQSAAKFTHR
jgi:hypothetical protein